MPVDRLTHIRHNWEEKGNAPRGRDVDFLLSEAERCRETLTRIRDNALNAAGVPDRDVLIAIKHAAAHALSATESAQSEEERRSSRDTKERSED